MSCHSMKKGWLSEVESSSAGVRGFGVYTPARSQLIKPGLLIRPISNMVC